MRDSGRDSRSRTPRRSQTAPGASSRRNRSGASATNRVDRSVKSSSAKAQPRAKSAAVGQRRPTNRRPRPTADPRRPRTARQPQRSQRSAANTQSLWQNKTVRLLMLLVLVVAVGGSAVYLWMRSVENQPPPPNPAAGFEAVACEPGMVDIQLDKTTGKAGQPINFELTISNPEKNPPCYIDVGHQSLWLEVTSGEQPVYNAKVCQAGPANKQLLLDKGMKTVQQIQWDGYNSGADCQGKDLAQPGTYVAELLLDGKSALDRPTIFELN
ncbi:MAG: hypothetical protein Q4E03_02730 [Trueperella sp.]|nr:hypothetical protein [Trueperella sp.]